LALAAVVDLAAGKVKKAPAEAEAEAEAAAARL